MPALTDSEPDSTAPPASSAPPIRRVLAGFLLPLWFLIGLPLGLVSAFHASAPHDLSLKIVGPSAVVGKLTDKLDATAQFSATQTDEVSVARSSVRSRDAVGSILVVPHSAASAKAAPTFSVTTYIASAGGRSAAAAVQAVGAKVATQLGTSSTVVDVAPLAATDTLGTTLFYLLTYSSLGGYLVIIVLTQVAPGARLRVRFGAVAGIAIVAPLVVFGLASIWVGDYGQSFGTIMALLGIDALSVFTVGALAILMQQLLGNGAMFGIMATVVFLNFPSAGGAVPASMLPPFWQALHSVWFGAGAYESFRSVVYFGGEQLGRWLPQLLAWTVGVVLITLLVELVKTVRRQRTELTALNEELAREVDREHELELELEPLRHEHLAAQRVGATRAAQQQSITTGSEQER